MSTRLIRNALVVLLLLSLVMVPLLVSRPVARVRTRVPAGPQPERDAPTPLSDGMDSLISTMIARTPFRARRAPAAVAYDPVRRDGVRERTSVTEPRPQLVLTGIVWEEQPSVVIEGLPGVDGPSVLRRNDVVRGLKVRRIEREQVVIAGLDTVWTLRVREPWR